MHWYAILGMVVVYTIVVGWLGMKYGRIVESRAQADLNQMRNTIGNRVGGAIAGKDFKKVS